MKPEAVVEKVVSARALAVARAAGPARTAASYQYAAHSDEEVAASIDDLVARVTELVNDRRAVRSSSMRTGVEVHADPFRVLVDVGHEEWADYTDIYEQVQS